MLHISKLYYCSCAKCQQCSHAQCVHLYPRCFKSYHNRAHNLSLGFLILQCIYTSDPAPNLYVHVCACTLYKLCSCTCTCTFVGRWLHFSYTCTYMYMCMCRHADVYILRTSLFLCALVLHKCTYVHNVLLLYIIGMEMLVST